VILEIPHGSYAPSFIRRARLQEGVEPSKAAPDEESGSGVYIEKRSKTLLNLFVISLMIITITLAYSNTQLRLQSRASAQSRGMNDVFKPLWETFLKDGNPALLVLGNPSVYRFKQPTDPASLSRMRIDLTHEESNAMGDVLGRERLVFNNPLATQLMLAYDEYACLGEAVGLFRIGGLFNKMGKTLTLKQSRRLVSEDLKNHNAILLGSSWVKEWLGNAPVRECFITGPAAAIINENLLPGDEREYVAKYDEATGKLIEDYALIAVKPGISERKIVMIVAGTRSEGTQAALEFLTDENFLADLNQRFHRTLGAVPKYFQVLLKVSVDSGIPTNISVIRVRGLHFGSDHI
jgi:hypothetical protein